MGYKISAYIRRFLNFIISFFLVLIFIIAAAYAVFVLYDNQRIYSAAENVQADMLKLKPDREKPDFSELLSINPDVCAWLTMDGTILISRCCRERRILPTSIGCIWKIRSCRKYFLDQPECQRIYRSI